MIGKCFNIDLQCKMRKSAYIIICVQLYMYHKTIRTDLNTNGYRYIHMSESGVVKIFKRKALCEKFDSGFNHI